MNKLPGWVVAMVVAKAILLVLIVQLPGSKKNKLRQKRKATDGCIMAVAFQVFQPKIWTLSSLLLPFCCQASQSPFIITIIMHATLLVQLFSRPYTTA
jgi:hypothetical protein